MTVNLFGDDEGSPSLVNDDQQHSLWPAFACVPTGRRVMSVKQTPWLVWNYVERNRTEIRSKVCATAGDEPSFCQVDRVLLGEWHAR